MEPNADTKAARLKNGLEAISKGSETLTTWALSVSGGSIASLIGSDYLRPTGKVRFLYLIFIPGWTLLAASLTYGNQLNASYMASVFTDNHERLLEIGQSMNRELRWQRKHLLFALVAFGIWIASLLVFWVFCPGSFTPESK